MERDFFRLAFCAEMSVADKETGEVMLYGQIVRDYGKWHKEQYPNDKSASDFDRAIKELKSKGAKKLNVRINSPGGIVTEAIAMRGILTGAGFEQINIRIEGLCASAATIVASIPGVHVVITPGSEYMIHNPWIWAFGNANEIEKTVEHLRQLEKTSRAFYVQKSGQAEDQIKRWMDDEKWFSAEDAVKYGFADELANEGTGEALPAAACVTSREMAAMCSIYRNVPKDNIAVQPENPTAPVHTGGAETNPVSSEAPVAGASTEITKPKEEHPIMEIKDINLDQLQMQNPALLEQIRQSAVTAERNRQAEIDDLTMPGYEEMAAKAKADGTSAMDFHKQMVTAMKQKGGIFLQQRQSETAPAAAVAGGAPQDPGRTPQQEIEDTAKDIAAYAKIYADNGDGTMF